MLYFKITNRDVGLDCHSENWFVPRSTGSQLKHDGSPKIPYGGIVV